MPPWSPSISPTRTSSSSTRARAFAEAEILPHIRAWDEDGGFPREMFGKLADQGFLGRAGPRGLRRRPAWTTSASRILCEELERADTSFRVIQSVHVGLNSLTLLQWGTEEQRQRWLVPQARGDKLATFGLTEPGVGTDAANLQTTARRDGDSYVLNGAKQWISLADLADHFLVFATVDREQEAQGHHGLRPRARDGRPDDRHAPRQARDPGGQHRAHQPRRRARAGREPHRRGGRGVPHRDERHRPGSLHGRGGRGRAGPGLRRRAASGTRTSGGRSATRSGATSSSSR